jgi:hypothetical protein
LLVHLSCVNFMKLALSASKRYVTRASGSKNEVFFTVLDLDKADSYPLNFVCLLPKKLESGCRQTNKFLKIYGKESSRIAIELLTNALRNESDLAVKTEIEKRLKELQPKPIPKIKCVSCGRIFEPKRYGRFLQRRCQTCQSKIIYGQ